MIFSPDESQWAQQLAVNVGQFQVYVAKCNWPTSDHPTDAPTWGTWRLAPNLRFESAFLGSSIAGMSYAHVSLANGAPLQSPQVDVEKDVTLNFGDRVFIQGIVGNATNPIFAGYCLGGDLALDADREALRFKIVGPEWLWGGSGPMNGSANPVVGQLRRKADADDYYMKHTTAENPVFSNSDQLYVFTTEHARFNPDGRRNMTYDSVYLDPDNTILGNVFETPERYTGGTLRVAAWTADDASEMLEMWYNDPTVTGIAHPNWQTTQLDYTTPLPDIDVDTDGLWDALRKVAGPNWGFYIDPRPGNQGGGPFKPTGTSWGPFAIRWFQRGVDIDGGQVDAYLNPRGTPAADAIASVQRLQASKSIEKTVTRVDVYARITRYLNLMYYGGNTPTVATYQGGANGEFGNLLLQHGWAKGELDLSLYAGTIAAWTGSTIKAVTPDTIAKANLSLDWQNQYCTDGTYFSAFRHCGRLFTWNEDGALQTTSTAAADLPVYADTTYAWYMPDLTGIADGEGPDAGKFCRRPRKLLDNLTPDAGAFDSWRRVPPTIYILSPPQNPASAGNYTYARIPTSMYRIDPERAAIWFTAHDLARWQPLMNSRPSNGADVTIPDPRSFATLLHTGQLGIYVEATIETDCVYSASAARLAIAGSPFTRRAILRKERDFIKSENLVKTGYATAPNSDSIGAYVHWWTTSGHSGNPPLLYDGTGHLIGPDTTAQALDLANQIQNAGQDQQTHASILFSADWPLQGIGKVLTSIAGRTINLTGGPSGRGAQVVALHLDPVAMKVEMLTETAALAMRKRHQAAMPHAPANKAAAAFQTAAAAVNAAKKLL